MTSTPTATDQAARKAVSQIEGDLNRALDEYAAPSWERHHAMLEAIRSHLALPPPAIGGSKT